MRNFAIGKLLAALIATLVLMHGNAHAAPIHTSAESAPWRTAWKEWLARTHAE